MKLDIELIERLTRTLGILERPPRRRPSWCESWIKSRPPCSCAWEVVNPDCPWHGER